LNNFFFLENKFTLNRLYTYNKYYSTLFSEKKITQLCSRYALFIEQTKIEQICMQVKTEMKWKVGKDPGGGSKKRKE
jgi:hypothetical protein